MICKNTVYLQQMNNRIKYLLLLTLFFSLSAEAQGFKMHFSNSFADCFGAVEVLDYDNPSRVQFPGNYGQRDDFVGFDPDFHEVNSVWLRLEPNLDGIFEFYISTENNVDFNFLLFKSENNSFCEDLEADKVTPIVDQATSYRDKGLKSNPDGEFKSSIDVKPNDVFYLLIHTNSTYKGHVSVRYKRLGKVTVTESVVQDFRTGKTKNRIRIRIRDKETGHPVEANMVISGVNKDNYLFLGTDFLFDATTAKEMHIESNTQGYFLFATDFVSKGMSNQNIDILLELDRLAPGKKLSLENIKFEEDTDDFLPIAYPALKRLLDFMAVNDELRVEIQGHVNAPGYKNTAKIRALSDARAKAVKKFLKDNGIDATRMTVEGYGNTEMLFDKPKEVWQQEANRRVEIKVIN